MRTLTSIRIPTSVLDLFWNWQGASNTSCYLLKQIIDFHFLWSCVFLRQSASLEIMTFYCLTNFDQIMAVLWDIIWQVSPNLNIVFLRQSANLWIPGLLFDQLWQKDVCPKGHHSTSQTKPECNHSHGYRKDPLCSYLVITLHSLLKYLWANQPQ